MPPRKKTIEMIAVAEEILEQYRPMTVRQVYYQLVSRHVIKNTRSQYQAVSRALVYARKNGIIPWHYIEDRMRRPRGANMWSGLPAFANTARRSYRRDVWADQPGYLEVWLEKDALSGIFGDVLWPFGVTLNVGRGYDGWSSIYNAANRFGRRDQEDILYFGDFDPSGRDIVRSLQERLEFFRVYPDIEICALREEDIEEYNLPPDFTKATDSRSPAFIAEFGDVAVELDALPVDVLRQRIQEGVENRMDLLILEETKFIEESERKHIVSALQDF